MRREKTVVDVNVTEEEKDAVLAKMVRDQQNVQNKIEEQQRRQEEMVNQLLHYITILFLHTKLKTFY